MYPGLMDPSKGIDGSSPKLRGLSVFSCIKSTNSGVSECETVKYLRKSK